MKILYLKTVPSTQLYLKELIQNNKIKAPVAVVANEQTHGIGSRNNSWNSKEGNLFLSFALNSRELPKDLKLESASIYFAYILKETLAFYGSLVFLKWPNDFYIGRSKVGGMITTIVGETLICGVGLNLDCEVDEFSRFDVDINKNDLIKSYFANLEKRFLWKQVFSKYKLEFHTNKNLFTHNDTTEISLDSTELEDDGSLSINGKRIYSRR
ncbi:biotin--[acetyl-CoA-carboxylase] ligase [Sulfurimonas sp.]